MTGVDYAEGTDIPPGLMVAVMFAVVVFVAATVTTWKLVADVSSPATVCEREIPLFEGFALTEVRRTWPPPLVRCEYVDRDPGQDSFRGTVTGLTSTHLGVVVVLDVAVIAVVVVGLSRWRHHRRSLDRGGGHSGAHA